MLGVVTLSLKEKITPTVKVSHTHKIRFLNNGKPEIYAPLKCLWILGGGLHRYAETSVNLHVGRTICSVYEAGIDP